MAEPIKLNGYGSKCKASPRPACLKLIDGKWIDYSAMLLNFGRQEKTQGSNTSYREVFIHIQRQRTMEHVYPQELAKTCSSFRGELASAVHAMSWQIAG